jgi:hypothetical protein
MKGNAPIPAPLAPPRRRGTVFNPGGSDIPSSSSPETT